ncbi:hypothetical protein [Helicobacter rodentium]|nr:hypothetical protein [Helicobacter rodentium]
MAIHNFINQQGFHCKNFLYARLWIASFVSLSRNDGSGKVQSV